MGSHWSAILPSKFCFLCRSIPFISVRPIWWFLASSRGSCDPRGPLHAIRSVSRQSDYSVGRLNATKRRPNSSTSASLNPCSNWAQLLRRRSPRATIHGGSLSIAALEFDACSPRPMLLHPHRAAFNLDARCRGGRPRPGGHRHPLPTVWIGTPEVLDATLHTALRCRTSHSCTGRHRASRLHFPGLAAGSSSAFSRPAALVAPAALWPELREIHAPAQP